MKESQVPSFAVVAFAGAAWLVALAVLLAVQVPGAGSLAEMLSQAVLSLLAASGAVYLIRLAIGFAKSEDSSRADAKEAIRRIDVTRRAA